MFQNLSWGRKKKIAELIQVGYVGFWFFFFAYEQLLFVWVAHVNHESDSHPSDQRRKNELYPTPATVLHQD